MTNPSPESVQFELPERVPVAFLPVNDVIALKVLNDIAELLKASPRGVRIENENTVISRELPEEPSESEEESQNG